MTTSRSRQSYFVYIMTCSDGTLYVGSTTDPDRRLAEHNSGVGSRYTRGRLPVRISHLERLTSRSEAQRREYEIKQMKKSTKLSLLAKAEKKSSR